MVDDRFVTHPMTVCITCGVLLPHGRSRCAAHTSKSSSRWAEHAARNPLQAAFYKSEAWRTLRREVLERDPDCRLRFPGCTGRSTEVDHVIGIDAGGSNDPANLRGVCHHCHRLKTQQESKEGNKAAARRRKQGGSDVR
jgi:5-methylcytosine-specific restriction protein A